ncbi:MAG TPA: RluA family pseudouridine synthase [Casimicrobiaceae bacterium]|nr:RluA family pseudouridine synthase [Casimicrobiaceae bacterium]
MKASATDAVRRVTVGEEGEGQRLDNYLVKTLKGVPKSHIYRIVRSGEVRVNRGRAAPDTRLTEGDELRIPPLRVARPEVASSRVARPVPDESLRILYEDEALLALDKPAGIAVHGGSGVSYGVIERLRRARPEARFLELVHRLDRETSGVLLVAKKRAALVSLHAQLRDGGVDKRYLVLVRGKWRDALRRVDLPLESRSVGGEKRVRVGPLGRHASTVFRLKERWPETDPPLSLLEAELETGRTHQIRVHLTHLGFPLAGDDKYGDFAWNKTLARQGLKRMFLHAAAVTFHHPIAGGPLRIEAALAPDLAQFLQRLPSHAERP